MKLYNHYMGENEFGDIAELLVTPDDLECSGCEPEDYFNKVSALEFIGEILMEGPKDSLLAEHYVRD